MVAEIRWSENAIQDYNLIIAYLLKNWNEGIALRFIEITEHKVQQVANHPNIGIPASRRTDIRSILITRHNRLYYKVLTEQMIEIVNIFDTRQEPSKNKFT